MKDSVFNNLISFGKLSLLASNNYLVPITINAESEVFKGHFPNQPVMPGVVQMELVKRAIELALELKIEMVAASNVKFLKMLIPQQHSEAELYFTIASTANLYKVKAQLKINNEIYFKSDASYTVRK